MSFEEMQSILQGILLSQQQFQAEMGELQFSQRQFQAEMGELRAITERTAQVTERTAQVTERTAQITERNSQIVESNSRAIQAMLDQAVTDRLLHEERTRQHEERMIRLEAMSEGLINLSTAIDEDRPTILRLLNSTNNKIDTILDRLPPQA